MKVSDGIQKSLPFGYMFLIIIGIFKESIQYYQLGINILNYSTITDILISPIVALTSHPVIFIAVVFMILFSYGYPVYLSKNKHKIWVQKLAGLNGKVLTDEEMETHFTNMFITLFAVTLLSFFIGMGFNEGKKLSGKIKENKLEYNYTLNYNSGEAEQVHLIGSNSIYYFYVKKGNKDIMIAPVGAIKNIELTNNNRLK